MAAESARLFTAANAESFTITDASLAMPVGTQFTVGGWYYFTTLPGGGQHLIGIWPNGPGFSHMIWMNGSTPTLQGATGSIAWGSTLSTGTWYFIEAGYNGTTGFIAVNRGTRVTGTFASSDTGSPFTIGNHAPVGGRPMDGRAQMMFVYKTTQATSAQLDDHYNGGSGNCYASLSDTSNMVSFWPGNEASGNLIDVHGTNTMTDVNTVTTAAGLVECAAAGTTPRMMLLGVG